MGHPMAVAAFFPATFGNDKGRTTISILLTTDD